MSSVIKINRINHASGLRVQTFNVEPSKDFETEEGYWSKKIENAKQQAFKEGYETAIQELESRFGQDLLNKYGEFENLILSLENQFKEYEQAFEKVVTQLAFDISETVIRRQIEVDPIVSETVKDAAQKIIGADKIIVRVNPSDYELLKDSGRGLFSENSFSQVKFEADSAIGKGGCIIESEIGNVDARINSQVAEIKNKITNNYLTEKSE